MEGWWHLLVIILEPLMSPSDKCGEVNRWMPDRSQDAIAMLPQGDGAIEVHGAYHVERDDDRRVHMGSGGRGHSVADSALSMMVNEFPFKYLLHGIALDMVACRWPPLVFSNCALAPQLAPPTFTRALNSRFHKIIFSLVRFR